MGQIIVFNENRPPISYRCFGKDTGVSFDQSLCWIYKGSIQANQNIMSE